MKKIFVEKIEDGMTLARDVCGTSGSALISKGTKLTVTMGRRLKNWGVTYVCIEGEEEHKEEKTIIEISPEKVKEQLEAQFADVINNPVMKTLLRAVYTFKTHQNLD